MIRLSLIGVRVEVPTNQPIVLLREEEGTRFLPIFIGSPEATAIVYALQGLATPRPLTHDLFKTVLDDLSVKLDRVEITKLHEGTFYAEIELDRGGDKSRISSRPSDAIALAVRFGGDIPIFADEAVLRGLAYNQLGQAQANMGVAVGDIDGDGLFDVYVTHLSNQRNTLWQQGPKRGMFQDRTGHAGLLNSRWRGTGFGTLQGDFDNDGWPDLAVVNGRVIRGTATPL